MVLPADIGLSVVYEPDCSPVVDIIFVHGLQGNPYRTWTSGKLPVETTLTASSPSSSLSEATPMKAAKAARLRRLRRFIPSRKKKSPQVDFTVPDASTTVEPPPGGGENGKSSSVFWPADLLPHDCPQARVLVYGYDTKITRFMSGATSQNSVFSHAKDLLFTLSRRSVIARPLVFVAHSLGGVVVKEMLARSSASTDEDRANIVDSTAAVIFMGTPHRGSPELAAVGQWARSIVSALRMKTTSEILDPLGLKTTDLERAQEAFSALWQKHDFRVKTFQEGLGLTGVNLGVLGNKVVPDYSSSLGDHREQVETLQANHREICRFTGRSDPNYQKVGGELRVIYLSIVKFNTPEDPPRGRAQAHGPVARAESQVAHSHGTENELAEKACLQFLRFPSMNARRFSVKKPADKTCLWLFEHELYLNWFKGESREKHRGLLRLSGKPGSGKSVLMKEAYHHALLWQAESGSCTAAFFFNSKGEYMEHSKIGLYRSLLYQLLSQHPKHLSRFRRNTEDLMRQRGVEEDDGMLSRIWSDRDLEEFLELILTSESAPNTRIFIDALDECERDEGRRQVFFWRYLTLKAYENNNLNVCLSGRFYPAVTVNFCPEIFVDRCNEPDIATYIEQRFELGISADEPRWRILRDRILRHSSGVFLWAILVVDDVLERWDSGERFLSLLRGVRVLPGELKDLFSQILTHLIPETRPVTARLFQWATLSPKPLRLHEWHHILAFVRQPVPSSLREWRLSDNYTENDGQLERQIRNLSKGLLEITASVAGPQDGDIELASVCAGAGSLNLEQGETRIVQVIHESVRDFFLNHNGFSFVDPDISVLSTARAAGLGHICIMATCLDYLKITELDALVLARTQPEQAARIDPIGPNTALSANVSGHERSVGKQSPPKAKNTTPYPSGHRDLHEEGFFAELQPYSDAVPRHKLREDFFLPPVLGKGRVSEEAVFKRLHSLAVDIDIDQTVLSWINGTSNADFADHAASGSKSPKQLSATGQSQVLEDYPALLSYALFKFFTHARQAKNLGHDLGPILERFQTEGIWSRWVALREDIPQGTTLASYFLGRGEVTGDKSISFEPEIPDRMHGSADMLALRSTRRISSVASFSSASSHVENG
ncbi:hypothetical protein B0T24DRAFT_605806 [Lasiosphaeria ovina]|uniref:Nephrocystin 3-like N-terminal domain-containing protein n=1 Tax=Lasiosphaeria ovina TaxID=92902 RepID=A0AAE0NLM9_9PEZI|nr:hypothetical protein B0T24DRAFT_605806 [Lasiosphaeria ovina]